MKNNFSRRSFLQTTLVGAMAFPTIVPSRVFGKNAPGNTIQIGQIGCGRIAREHDLPEILKYENARVIALCDVDSKRVQQCKEYVRQWYAKKKNSNNMDDIKTYSDYRKMLLNPHIDAVIISTPDHWHAQPAIEAALHGKDIYLQKPTSLTIAEGRLLSDTIHRTGCILQLGSQQRSMKQFRIACELVRNGRIGSLKTIQIGLPVDPAGEFEPEMPVPQNLDYDTWLGSTPFVYYTEKRVHPQNDYSRPGWLRCEQFGAGMITGWGAHHLDIANWAMDTEYTGPVEVEAFAEYPQSGLWDVHGKYYVTAKFVSGVTMNVSDQFPNGVRFEGDAGWIFVTREGYAATSSDPVSKHQKSKALQAGDEKILKNRIGENEIHLHESKEHHGDWLNSIRTRKPPAAPAEVGHRACSACLICHIAMKLKRRLYWDPVKERFKNDDEANSMLSRPQRYPYGATFLNL